MEIATVREARIQGGGKSLGERKARLNGWFNGSQPLVEIYPEIVAVCEESGELVTDYLRDEIGSASMRQAGEAWVLRSDFYRKLLGAYIMNTTGAKASEAAKFARDYTLGWSKVSTGQLLNAVDSIDTLSYADLKKISDDTVRTAVIKTLAKLDEDLVAGKYAVPDGKLEAILEIIRS